jgi:hypothetical protein
MVLRPRRSTRGNTRPSSEDDAIVAGSEREGKRARGSSAARVLLGEENVVP